VKTESSTARIAAFLRRYGILVLFLAFAGWWYFRYKVVHTLQWEEIVVYTSPETTENIKDVISPPCIVHFYANWCGPCIAELPELSKFTSTFPEYQLILISDDSWDKLNAVSSKYDMRIVRVDDMDYLGVHTIPTTYFFDRKGESARAIQGQCEWNSPSFQSEIKTLLQP